MSEGATGRRRSPSREARRLTYLAFALLGLLVSVTGVWSGSYAAFNRTTSNGTNSFASGQVAVATDAPGTAVFATTVDMVPGTSYTRCVRVTYSGTVSANVRLYGQDYSGDIGPYLDLSIDRGTGTNASCSDFASPVNVFTGTLETFRTGRTDFASGVDTWGVTGSGQTRTYRLTYQLQSGTASQEKSGSIRLTWEAQS